MQFMPDAFDFTRLCEKPVIDGRRSNPHMLTAEGGSSMPAVPMHFNPLDCRITAYGGSLHSNDGTKAAGMDYIAYSMIFIAYHPYLL